ncbi:MAG: transcription elongation factor GreA [Planctomycetaceae bacterium]
MERQPITREGYDKLVVEIRHLESVKMPEIAIAIAEARAEGDLKENAEYHGQREEQGRTMAKINQLKTKLASCYIVEKADMPKGVVAFGSIVTVKDTDLDEEETYEFVGPGEEDYNGDIMKILTTSPIAKALMGKKEGDSVEVELPRGSMTLEIVKIVDHGDQ